MNSESNNPSIGAKSASRMIISRPRLRMSTNSHTHNCRDVRMAINRFNNRPIWPLHHRSACFSPDKTFVRADLNFMYPPAHHPPICFSNRSPISTPLHLFSRASLEAHPFVFPIAGAIPTLSVIRPPPLPPTHFKSTHSFFQSQGDSKLTGCFPVLLFRLTL